jgi:hypothetical protein
MTHIKNPLNNNSVFFILILCSSYINSQENNPKTKYYYGEGCTSQVNLLINSPNSITSNLFATQAKENIQIGTISKNPLPLTLASSGSTDLPNDDAVNGNIITLLTKGSGSIAFNKGGNGGKIILNAQGGDGNVQGGEGGTIIFNVSPGLGGNQTLGTIYIKGLKTGIGNQLCITNNNEIVINSSSKKYKENITELIINENDLLLLHEVVFNYKADPQKHKVIGLIAEDLVGTPFEDAIFYDTDGNPNGIDYNSILMYFLASYKKTIKNHKEEIDILKEKYINLTILLENKTI